MRISDWSSDVCSSDLGGDFLRRGARQRLLERPTTHRAAENRRQLLVRPRQHQRVEPAHQPERQRRSEEHTSELQSLMRISYAVFCLKKKKKNTTITKYYTQRNH